MKEQNPYFHDVRFALANSKNVTTCSNVDYFPEILNHDRFNAYIRQKSHMPTTAIHLQKKQNQSKKRKNASYMGREASSLTFNVKNAEAQLEEMRS